MHCFIAIWSLSLSKDLFLVIYDCNDANEDEVTGNIDVEKRLAGTVFGAYEKQVLDDDDNDKHWHLELNTLVVETDWFDTFQTDEKGPSEAHEACDLENLSTECLCKTHTLIFDLGIESVYGLLKVNFLFVISEGNTEGIEHHGKHIEVPVEGHGEVKCEPYNDARVDEDPDHGHEESDWIKIFSWAIDTSHRVWNRNVLEMGQWHK